MERSPALFLACFCNFCDNVLRRAVNNRLRGVEAQSIKMKFADPITCVGDVELANGAGVFPVEIDRFPQSVFITVREIIEGEALQVVSNGTDVVINYVENHPESHGMGTIYKVPEIVRITIEPRGSIQVHAIVTPTKSAGKVRAGHDLEEGNTHISQFCQIVTGRIPGSFSVNVPM